MTERLYSEPAPGTMGRVPNKPKTPVTNFRIPEDLKRAAVERAASEGKTLTDVVVESLTRYVKRKPTPKSEGQASTTS